MKKILLLALVVIVGFCLKGQTPWTGISIEGNTYRNGNVGIGILNPSTGLHVKGVYPTGFVTIERTGVNTGGHAGVMSLLTDAKTAGDGIILSLGALNSSDVTQSYGSFRVEIVNPAAGSVASDLKFYNCNAGIINEAMTIKSAGFVGIGTNNPKAKLHIENGANSDAVVLATSSEFNKLIVSSGATTPAYVSTFKITHEFVNDRRNGYISFHRGADTFGGFLTFGSSGQERLRINELGNVGIGTTNLSPANLLTVAGKISSREVEVKIDAGADFVFAPNYPIKSIEEVEAYIKENKHLENIPSATEMEANGIELGNMNIKLLQKVEELTLYLIEQNKTMKSQSELLKEQNETLKSQNDKIKVLEEKLKNLESIR